MTQGTSSEIEVKVSRIERYVPLIIFVVVALTFLCIGLKIIGYGYLPPDDALRHAAKAVSGKPWTEILVLEKDYKVDHNFGWHLFLRQIHLWTHCDTEGLVLFSVVGLFTLLGLSALPWLRRPEAWLLAVLAFYVCGAEHGRLMLGRPFLLSISVLVTILFAWQIRGSSPPGWRIGLMMTALIALAIFVHGVWYLWLLPLTAFVLARQYRWAFVFGLSWIAGTILAASLTGQPVDYITGAIHTVAKAFSAHTTKRTQVAEFQPFSGDYSAVMLLGGLVIMRRLTNLPALPLTASPAFWLMCINWVLGFMAVRFWIDWGCPALLVLIACDLQLFLETRFDPHSLKRLALACAVALTTYLAATSDIDSRWTGTLVNAYLIKSDPEVAEWLPEKGGILYSVSLAVFYQTFFKNPHGDWRYILGYESALMPPEDFEVYHKIRWNFNDYKAYQPWVDKMRPEDRLVIYDSKSAKPGIPELEWHYPVSSTWVGRVPRTNAVPSTAIPSK